MPKINVQIVGMIEIDAPPRYADPCVASGSQLWNDLSRIGRQSARSARKPRKGAGAVYADFPRLTAELSAELSCLVERIHAAQEA